MKKANKNQRRELAALVALKDSLIDTSDIAEISDWTEAKRGRFYRPVKEPVTLRLDADVLDWLKSQGAGYQTRINKFLRAAMLHSKASRKRA